MNIWDIVLLLLITAAVGLAVFRICKNRRGGKSCCGCSGCSQACPARERER